MRFSTTTDHDIYENMNRDKKKISNKITSLNTVLRFRVRFFVCYMLKRTVFLYIVRWLRTLLLFFWYQVLQYVGMNNLTMARAHTLAYRRLNGVHQHSQVQFYVCYTFSTGYEINLFVMNNKICEALVWNSCTFMFYT